MQAFNREPDWRYWVNLAEVQLWQAVALSLNIEPRSLSPINAPPSRVPNLLYRGPADYVDRLRVAEGHLSSLETVPAPKGCDRAPVRLLTMRRWAESLPAPWTFPNGFPSAVVEHVRPQVRERGEPGAAEVAATDLVMHSTKGRRPTNPLRPVIDEARRLCRDPNDADEVWARLQSLAEGREPEPPLIECTKRGVVWRNGSEDATLTREMLGKRLKRNPWSPLTAADRR